MRICLECELVKEEFPINYRKIIISMIKNALSKCNGGSYFKLYYNNTSQKDFSISIKFNNPKFGKNNITLGNRNLQIYISTDDARKTGFILYASFLNQKNQIFSLPNDNALIIHNIKQIEQKNIISSQCLFQTGYGSPLVIREHNRESNRDKFYSIDDMDYSQKALSTLQYQARLAGFPEYEIKELKFQPCECRKVVVKYYDIYLDATIGTFILEGTIRLLQHFYQNGVGSHRSACFGYLNLLAQTLMEDET